MAKTIISAKGEGLLPYLKEVIHFRSLIVTLALRDIKIQYAQTALGVLWAALQPLTGLLIFTIFFDKLIQVDTGGMPYPLFAFSGMLAWFFFTSILHRCGFALLHSQDLMANIYFPKLILPLSKVIVGLVEFFISMIIFFIIMAVLGHAPGIQILMLPVFILLNILVGLAVGIWLSALTIRFRDFQHIIPYLINFGIWLTPVFYPSTLIPEKYSFLLYCNPMAGVISGYRWALLGDTAPSPFYWLVFIPLVLLLIGGLSYFKKVERKVVDYI